MDDNDPKKTVNVPLGGEGMKRTPLLAFVSFSIVESERRMTDSLSLKDYYTVYLIETRYVVFVTKVTT
jgi:hypothetical protein